MKLQGKAGRRRRKWKIVVGGLLAGVALCLGAFFWYVSDYYHADARAMAIAQQGTGIETVENLTIFFAGGVSQKAGVVDSLWDSVA